MISRDLPWATEFMVIPFTEIVKKRKKQAFEHKNQEFCWELSNSWIFLDIQMETPERLKECQFWKQIFWSYCPRQYESTYTYKPECRLGMDKEEWNQWYFQSYESALEAKETSVSERRIWHLRGWVRGRLKLTIAFVNMKINTIFYSSLIYKHTVWPS